MTNITLDQDQVQTEAESKEKSPDINLDNNTKITWCPGCGNFSIIASLKSAIKQTNIAKEKFIIVGDVGCSSKMPYYIDLNTLNSLHGRAVPTAEGIRLANTDLNVIAIGGDGGLYGEGGNHILHAARRNINITLLVANNQIYGLTKGQASPTSYKGTITGATPGGTIETPFNPLAISLMCGATFVARGFSADIPQLSSLIYQGITHKGFSIIDILSPCISFNKVNNLQWYKDHTYKLEDEAKHNPVNFEQALAKVQKDFDKIPVGVIYQKTAPTYEEQVSTIAEKSLISQNIDQVDITNLTTSL